MRLSALQRFLKSQVPYDRQRRLKEEPAPPVFRMSWSGWSVKGKVNLSRERARRLRQKARLKARG